MVKKGILLTIDMAIFSMYQEELCLLTLKRENPPFAYYWALPDTSIDVGQDSDIEDAVKRKLKQLINVNIPYLEQVETVGDQFRDPRGWSITINYYGLLGSDHIAKMIPEYGVTLQWMTVKEAIQSTLAFDHKKIVKSCLQRFQNKSLYTSLPIFLLPHEFTLTEIQRTYEKVLDFPIEKKSFRRRLLDAHFLEETGNIRRASNRPAQLYRLCHPQPYFFPRIIEGVRENKMIE